jgi:glycosyltransferase involved in cell wall biosynthesis
MIHGKKIVVVMPAYNAERTVERTVREIPAGFVDEIILVDDHSDDQTVAVAQRLGLRTLRHPHNRGYGGNQKTCYREALRLGADVVVMLHPDYQYSPRLVPAMASMVAIGQYELVLARASCAARRSRRDAVYKYVMNRVLTLIQNILLHAKLSEYHTGYRAFSRRVLEELPLEENSEDFVSTTRSWRRRSSSVTRSARSRARRGTCRGVVDLVSAERQVRLRSAADVDRVSPGQVGPSAPADLQGAGAAAAGDARFGARSHRGGRAGSRRRA